MSNGSVTTNPITLLIRIIWALTVGCYHSALYWLPADFVTLRSRLCRIYTFAVLFCLQGKLLSFQKWYEGRERSWFGEQPNWRVPCHIQLSKCVRQQSLLVTRAWGRDWFLTSSPEIFQASHGAEMCSDAFCSGNSLWFCQRPFSAEPFRSYGWISFWLPSIRTALSLAWKFGDTFGLHILRRGGIEEVQHRFHNISVWGIPHSTERKLRDLCVWCVDTVWHVIVKLCCVQNKTLQASERS